MTLTRKALLVVLGALALQGVQACATDTELNPQPLPPGGEPTAVGDPEDGDDRGGSSGGGSSGTSPPAPSADGGVGDAADASDGASDAGDASDATTD